MLLESFIVDVVLLTETEGIDKQASNLPTEQANRGGATHNQDRQKRPGQSHTSLAGTRYVNHVIPHTEIATYATVVLGTDWNHPSKGSVCQVESFRVAEDGPVGNRNRQERSRNSNPPCTIQETEPPGKN